MCFQTDVLASLYRGAASAIAGAGPQFSRTLAAPRTCQKWRPYTAPTSCNHQSETRPRSGVVSSWPAPVHLRFRSGNGRFFVHLLMPHASSPCVSVTLQAHLRKTSRPIRDCLGEGVSGEDCDVVPVLRAVWVWQLLCFPPSTGDPTQSRAASHSHTEAAPNFWGWCIRAHTSPVDVEQYC